MKSQFIYVFIKRFLINFISKGVLGTYKGLEKDVQNLSRKTWRHDVS